MFFFVSFSLHSLSQNVCSPSFSVPSHPSFCLLGGVFFFLFTSFSLFILPLRLYLLLPFLFSSLSLLGCMSFYLFSTSSLFILSIRLYVLLRFLSSYFSLFIPSLLSDCMLSFVFSYFPLFIHCIHPFLTLTYLFFPFSHFSDLILLPQQSRVIFNALCALFETDKAVTAQDEVSIEADIRSEEKEKRRLTFAVNGERLNVVIIGVPESIRLGVCLISLSHILFYST